MLRNLRVKLTGWFVLLVMLVYIGDGIAALFIVDYNIKTTIYQDLVRQCAEVVAAVQIVDGKPTLRHWADQENRFNVKPDATILLFDANKNLLEKYGAGGVGVLQNGLLANSVYSTFTKFSNYGFVEVQVPTTQHDKEIFDYGILKAVRGVFIMLAIGICGWLYSGKAIEPVVSSIRTLRTFVADAGHELRTPVTVIEGSLETLEADLIEHGISTDILAVMMRASTRLKHLSTNLLLLARMENPEMELRKIPLDTEVLVQQVIDEMSERAHSRKVTLSANGTPSATIQGDKDSLARVFSNVIENAIRYTPEGGTIKVSGWKQESAVCISVEDTGIGIPQESLPHIFDRFYRVDKARTREEGGSGLGLAIVKAIVDAHGGEITVASQVGTGTKVVITLPVAA